MENKNLIDKAIGFIQKIPKTICRCRALQTTRASRSPTLMPFSDGTRDTALWNMLGFTSLREVLLSFAEQKRPYLKLRLLLVTRAPKATHAPSKAFTALRRANTAKSILGRLSPGTTFPVKLQSAISDGAFRN